MTTEQVFNEKANSLLHDLLREIKSAHKDFYQVVRSKAQI